MPSCGRFTELQSSNNHAGTVAYVCCLGGILEANASRLRPPPAFGAAVVILERGGGMEALLLWKHNDALSYGKNVKVTLTIKLVINYYDNQMEMID